ncbi:MAG: fumarylacetoacetate hydrolase family protein, partial [Chloroflexi bacterium]|nr:fumarylacetoacetate hydrolase family protein [Chloroflexota bacterium]
PLPAQPSFLWCPSSMLCGPEADVRIPEAERHSEYGAELGVVLARDCYRIAESDAGRYVLGYTPLNNVWSKGSGLRVYDTYCPVGPLLDTGEDALDASIRLCVDDAVRQEDRTSSMLFSPQRLVAALSRLVPLRQGDLIMTGTPGGIEGYVLHYGETMTVTIDGLGALRNRVVRADQATPTSIVGVTAWLSQPAGQEYLRVQLGSRAGGERSQ